MRLPTTRLLLVCLALTGTFGHAGAAELRHPPQETTPPADTPAPNTPDRLDEADIDAAVAAAHAQQRAQKPKPQVPSTTRPPSSDRTLPSRFHSFLPGMFR